MIFKLCVGLFIIHGFISDATCTLSEVHKRFLQELSGKLMNDRDETVDGNNAARKVVSYVEAIEKQIDASEIEKKLMKLSKEYQLRLNDKNLSDNAKSCLKIQHDKVKEAAEEGRQAVAACRASKYEDLQKARTEVLKILSDEKEITKSLRGRPGECLIKVFDFKDAKECLTKIASAGRLGALKMRRKLKKSVSELKKQRNEASSCVKSALKVFKDQLNQIRKYSFTCLRLTDRMYDLQVQ